MSAFDASPANTIEWLESANTTIAVPVYQRQYRWETDRCQRLFEDILAVADADEGHTHFIGSILSSESQDGDLTKLTLIDGQQRVGTLFILMAAVRDTVKDSDPALAARLDGILRHPTDPTRTRLEPHHRRASVWIGIVFGRPLTPAELEVSYIDDNYEFFLSKIGHQSDRVWRGLQRLEHVDIRLRKLANAQQIFESLNATGTPLYNHELIHNYTLMGLSIEDQTRIENTCWAHIEANTGGEIEGFLRDLVIMKSGRDTDLGAPHGVYNAFKTQYPHLPLERLEREAAEWRTYSEIYARLLDPAKEDDADIASQFRHVKAVSSTMYPLILGVYRDYQTGKLKKDKLIEILERLESLFLRKMVVGESRDHLIAQLCRRWRQHGYPIRDLLRRAPSNERVRNALQQWSLPRAPYVLTRMQDTTQTAMDSLQLEHIFPQYPGAAWRDRTGRRWSSFSEDRRARYRQLLDTLGNLTLLEGDLNRGAGNKSFGRKRRYYRLSAVPETRELAELPGWGVEAIEQRTAELTERFLEIWRRPIAADDEGPVHFVPILDAPRYAGWYPGWATEFEYVKFQGEAWEVRNIKELHRRVYERLWNTRPVDVQAYQDSMVRAGRAEGRNQIALDDSHYLYNGWIPQYLLVNIQTLLEKLELADDVLIKYASEDY